MTNVTKNETNAETNAETLTPAIDAQLAAPSDDRPEEVIRAQLASIAAHRALRDAITVLRATAHAVPMTEAQNAASLAAFCAALDAAYRAEDASYAYAGAVRSAFLAGVRS